jgi:hypothetical protein
MSSHCKCNLPDVVGYVFQYPPHQRCPECGYPFNENAAVVVATGSSATRVDTH